MLQHFDVNWVVAQINGGGHRVRSLARANNNFPDDRKILDQDAGACRVRRFAGADDNLAVGQRRLWLLRLAHPQGQLDAALASL